MLNKIEKITKKIYIHQHRTYHYTNAYKRFLKVYQDPKTFGLKKKHFYNKKVLDLGCGSSGYLQKAMENLKCHSVTCSDLGTKYIEDLKVFAKKNINKKDFLIYKSQNVKKLTFKSDSFDIVFLNGVIMHLQNLKDVKKSLLEAQRVVKKNGFIWIDAGLEDTNGIVEKFLLPALRKAYTDNHLFKKFIDNLDEKTIKNFLDIYRKKLNKKDFYLIKNFIEKYITIETFTFFQNVLQVPKQLSLQISFKFVSNILKKCVLKKTQPQKFDRTDIRKFMQPFYGGENHISKIFYNKSLHVLAKKTK